MRQLSLLPLPFLLALPAALAAEEAMTPEVVVSAEDCDERDPQVAYNSLRDEFLVVWNDVCYSATPAARVLARRLNRYGLPVGATFEVSPTEDGRNRSRASVAYDPVNDRYLVVYAMDYWNNGSDLDIRGRFLAWDGVVPGWGEVIVSQSTDNEWNPEVSLSAATGNHLVAWSTLQATAGTVVWGALIAFGYAPSVFAIASPGFRIAPDLSYDATRDRFAVAYDDTNDALARLVEATNGAVLGEITVANSAPNESIAATASCGGGKHLVAWQWLYGAGDTDVAARFVDGDGVPGAAVFEVCGTAGREQFVEASCLASASSYLLAFELEFDGGDFGLGGRCIREDGAVRPWFFIRGLSGGETGMTYRPAVAGGRAGWLVVWEHQRQSPQPPYVDIHARVIWELFADGFEWGTTDSWSSVQP